jgi:hypothetical protein
MNIALTGATGNVGSKILAEALDRGHAVTGIARHPERLSAHPRVKAARGDVADASGLASLLAGHDAVISAVRFQGLDIEALLRAAKGVGVQRLLMVGGAGSLEVSPGVQLVDTPTFPEAYKAEALAGRAVLDRLRAEPATAEGGGVEWTFLSPSALLTPGERTGRFRLGADQLLVAADGTSSISIEDYAVALIDELERPAHSRRRFTVGY